MGVNEPGEPFHLFYTPAINERCQELTQITQ